MVSRSGVSSEVPEDVREVGSFRVFPSQPLGLYETANAKVFLAQRKSRDAQHYCAYQCDRSALARLSAIEAAKALRFSGLVSLEDWDIVRDNNGIERPTLVYALPKGHLYMDSLQATTAPMSLKSCVEHFLKPALAPLHAMHLAGLTYRAFSPTNLFVQSDMRGFTLGQFLSEPAGTLQPRLCETITCAMADPHGRGSEVPPNDYYAMGVMILCLLRGHLPLRSLSEEHVLLEKFRRGSYRALVGNTQLDVESTELLRGLLDDNPATRWGHNAVVSWLRGRRLGIDNHFIPPRAKVPFYFQGQPISTRQELCYLMHRHWSEVLDVFANPDLGHWLRRSFNDDVNAKAILECQTDMHNAQKKEAYITRILMLLNPLAPLLARTTSCTLSGVGQLLMRYHNDSEKAQTLVGLLESDTIAFWTRKTPYNATVHIALADKIKSAAYPILRRASTATIPRLLYGLNSDAPCMSPLFARDYVYGLADFIQRLEARLSEPNSQQDFHIDAHIIAYIEAHHEDNTTDWVNSALLAQNPVDSGIATARLLGLVQKHHDLTPAPRLCRALVRILEPAVERFYNVSLKQTIRNEMASAATAGWIQWVVSVATNATALSQDAHRFAEARARYRRNQDELTRIMEIREKPTTNIRQRAHRIAFAMTAGITATGFFALLLRLF